MVRKTKDEALETREGLLDAAVQVFGEKGVSQASLADIAAAAGVTRGAIYWHFKNKADLIDALFERTKIPQEAAWGDCCAAAERDPLGFIRRRAVAALRLGTTDENTRRVWNILFHKCEPAEDTEPIAARKLSSRHDCALNMESFFRAAIDRGQLSGSLDPHTATTGLSCYLDGLIYNWLMDPEAVPLARDAERYVDIYLDGLKQQ
jgi:TetR/AcrR family transcriptional regulator, acrAB operon repressor